jgi:hypothetical protein
LISGHTHLKASWYFPISSGKVPGHILQTQQPRNEADCQWQIPCHLKEFFDAGIIMAFIGDLNEGLLSSHIGKWLERGQERLGPFDFARSLSTSQSDLQQVRGIIG